MGTRWRRRSRVESRPADGPSRRYEPNVSALFQVPELPLLDVFFGQFTPCVSQFSIGGVERTAAARVSVDAGLEGIGKLLGSGG